MATSKDPPLRIEDYGLIGDMRTCALVGKNGSIDFLCWPKFDSPSVFARILDTIKGSTGHWSIKPRLPSASLICKQHYRASTNILQTTFIHEDGAVNITDFFVLPAKTTALPSESRGSVLVRNVECVRGYMPIDIEINPALNYAKDSTLLYCTPVRRKDDTYHQRLQWRLCGSNADLHAPAFQVIFRSHTQASRIPTLFSSNASKALAGARLTLAEGEQVFMVMTGEDTPSLTIGSVFSLEREVSSQMRDTLLAQWQRLWSQIWYLS
jgi:Domain of unknown function (DUF5911)